MASIKKHVSTSGNETYKVMYRKPFEGRTKQASRSYSTERGAQMFMLLIEEHGPEKAERIDDGIDNAPPPPPEEGAKLLALGTSWLTARKVDANRGDITKRTFDNYARDWNRWILPRLGHFVAEKLNDRDVQEWVDWMRLQPRSSHKSISDRKATLGMIYRWAATHKGGSVITPGFNPASQVEVPRRGYKPPKGLRMPEVIALMEAAREMYPPCADLLAFMLGSGWRLQEAFALTVGQVEDDGVDVWVTMSRVWRRDVGFVEGGKSDSAHRRIRLVGEAVSVVRRRVVGKGPGDLVFTVARGMPWDETTFRRDYLNRISAAAGLTGDRRPTPHWLRHTHVMICHAAGMSLVEIQRRIGHADIRITMNTYGRMIDDMSDGVATRLDALLSLKAQSLPIATNLVDPPDELTA